MKKLEKMNNKKRKKGKFNQFNKSDEFKYIFCGSVAEWLNHLLPNQAHGVKPSTRHSWESV